MDDGFVGGEKATRVSFRDTVCVFAIPFQPPTTTTATTAIHNPLTKHPTLLIMAEASSYRRMPRLADCLLSDHRNLDALQKQLDQAVSSKDQTFITMAADTAALFLRLRVLTDQQILLPALKDMLGDTDTIQEAQAAAEQLLPKLDKLMSASEKEAPSLASEAVKEAISYAQMLEESLVEMQKVASHTQMTALEKQRCEAMYALQL